MSDNTEPRVLECESCGWQGLEFGGTPVNPDDDIMHVTHHRMQRVGNPFASPYILCDDCVERGIASGQWIEHPLHTKEEGYDE